MIKKITLIGIMLFLFWISFFPEPVQDHYKVTIRFFLVLLLLLTLLNRATTKAKSIPVLDLCFWVYIFTISLSINFAENADVALAKFLIFSIPAVLIFYLFKMYFSLDNYKMVFASLAIFSTTIAIFGISELFLKKNFLYEKFIFNVFYNRFISQGRIMSTLIHPNILGSYLLTCCPFSYYFVHYRNSKAIRSLGIASFTILIIGMIFTLSRGTWLAGIIVLYIYLMKINKKRLFVIIILLLLLFSLYSQFLSNNSVLEYRFGIISLAKYLNYGHRIIKYPMTFRILSEHPFVGLGLGNYRLLFDRYFILLFNSDGRYKLSYFPDELKITDSVYLGHLGETGIIGFLGFSIFLIMLFKKIIDYIHLSEDSDIKIILPVIAFALFGLLLNMSTFDAFYWYTPMYLFWVLVGIAVAIISKKRYAKDDKAN